MKHLIAAVSVIVSLLFGSGLSFGKGNGGNSSSHAAPAAHRSSAAPTTTAGPRFSGVPHSYSGGMPYRPVVSYGNGKRTLNYPPVGLSTVHHSTPGHANRLNTAYASHHGRSSNQSANFHRSGNAHQSSAINAIGKNKLDPQTSARLRNWNGHRDSVSQAQQNHVNHCHHHHGSNWWRHRCATIIFFDFGWWGWYNGWWYPAWGYDPYSYYEYNEPIYGYDGLSPDQIVASVQVALQQQGYYSYEIDGRMGPLTRAAIARYQRDHRLPITSGIDPATLGSLGVIH